MYLKKRELTDCAELFSLMTHPDVFPFVREKPKSYEEFLFITKKVIEAEDSGKYISRTIIDEWENPIGVITLYDIESNAGFLGTWLGKPYHGKGYNMLAKELFFEEIFYDLSIETIFMRIRQENIRSQKAAEKIPYITLANGTRPSIYQKINQNELGYSYHLYEISKDAYTLYHKKSHAHLEDSIQPLDA